MAKIYIPDIIRQIINKLIQVMHAAAKRTYKELIMDIKIKKQNQINKDNRVISNEKQC